MATARGLLIDLGMNVAQLQKDISNATNHLNRFTKNTSSLFKTLSFGVGATGLIYIAKSALDAMDSVAKMSQKVGVSTDTLQFFQYAAKLSGIEIEGVSVGLGRLSKKMLEAASGSDGALRVFQALNIPLKDNIGNLRNSDQIIMDVAEKFSRMKDGTNKTALAMELFGRSGKELIPLLNEGREGLEKLKDEAEKLGVILDSEAIKRAEEFQDNLERLEMASKSLVMRGLSAIIPVLNDVVESFIRSSTKAENFQYTAEGIGKILKWITATGIGAIAVFDTLGTLIGELGAALFTKGGGAVEGTFLKKLQNYGELINNITGNFEKQTNIIKKSGGNIGDILLPDKKALDAMDDWINKLDELNLEFQKMKAIDELDKQLTELDIKWQKLFDDAEKKDKDFHTTFFSDRLVEISSLKLEEQEWVSLQFELKEAIRLLEAQYNAYQNNKKITDSMTDTQIKYQNAVQSTAIQSQIASIERLRGIHGMTEIEALKQKRDLELQNLDLYLKEHEALAARADTEEDLIPVWGSYLDYLAKRNELETKYNDDILKEQLDKYGIIIGTYNGMAESFQNLFIDVMKGDLKDFSDYFDMVIDSIERSFAQGLAKMLTDWLFTLSEMESSSGGGLFGGISGIIGGLGSFLGIGGGASTGGAAMGAEFFTPEAIASMVWLHKGGVVGMEGKGGYAPASLFNNAPRLHRGISSDEAPVILQKGETVLPRGAGNIVINMNVKGSIVTERELARTLVPLISKAQREGAH